MCNTEVHLWASNFVDPVCEFKISDFWRAKSDEVLHMLSIDCIDIAYGQCRQSTTKTVSSHDDVFRAKLFFIIEVFLNHASTQILIGTEKTLVHTTVGAV